MNMVSIGNTSHRLEDNMKNNSNNIIKTKEENTNKGNKVEPLKDTSDELNLSDDELKEILDKSNKEYEEILTEKKGKTGIIVKLLALGILVLLIITLRVIVKTNNDVSIRANDAKEFTVTVNEEGDIVTSNQNMIRE